MDAGVEIRLVGIQRSHGRAAHIKRSRDREQLVAAGDLHLRQLGVFGRQDRFGVIAERDRFCATLTSVFSASPGKSTKTLGHWSTELPEHRREPVERLDSELVLKYQRCKQHTDTRNNQNERVIPCFSQPQ
jgi:hypothetical protein